MLRRGRHRREDPFPPFGVIGGKKQSLRNEVAYGLLIARTAQFGDQPGHNGASVWRQDNRRVEHDEGGDKLGIARREIERDNPAHAVPDDDDLPEAEMIADEGDIVGKTLHRVTLARLVAEPMSAQVESHDPTPFFGEIFELRGEIGVIAAPAVDQHDGSAHALRFLESRESLRFAAPTAWLILREGNQGHRGHAASSARSAATKASGWSIIT